MSTARHLVLERLPHLPALTRCRKRRERGKVIVAEAGDCLSSSPSFTTDAAYDMLTARLADRWS
jgi:hypothetical protein